MHNSQLGPGRTADWADGVVGKVYMYITGCVSAHRVSQRSCMRIYLYILWEVVGVTDCQYEHVTRVCICPASIVF